MRHRSGCGFVAALCTVFLLRTSVGAADLPANWQSLPAGEFAAAAGAFLNGEPVPTAEQAGPVVQHAWNAFLATDALTSPLQPSTLTALIDLVRPREVLAAELIPIGTAELRARFAAIENGLRAQIAGSGAGVGAQDFSVLMRLWSEQLMPRYELHQPSTLAQAGAVASAWMAQNDWQALPLVEKSFLAEFLASDITDRNWLSWVDDRWSARWTGSIRAPAAGTYRLGQLRHIERDGYCRITVGNQTVLDTFPGADPPAAAGPVYWSAPVNLPQSAVPIRVEYSYNVHTLRTLGLQTDYAELYPMMVLLWDSQGIGQQLVPASALAPPPNAAGGATSGLYGEYFNQPDFAEPVASQIDRQLNFVWYMAPVVPRYGEQFQAVLSNCLATLSDRQAATPDERAARLWYRLANLCNYSQRRQILNWLLTQPEELVRTSSPDFGYIWSELAMAPDGACLELLERWDRQHPIDSPVVNQEQARGLFRRNNHQGYVLIGAWLSGSRVERLNQLLASGLVSDAGQPRLNMICAAGHALRIEKRVSELQTFLQEQLDAAASGDERARWLAAQAWAEESYAFVDVTGAEGLRHFAAALEEAESLPLKFEITCQLAVREICLGLADQVDAWLTAAESRFTEPDQQATLAKLRASAELYGPLVADWGRWYAAKETAAAKSAHLERLRTRLERAQASGDSATAASLSSQLDFLEAK